MRWTASTILSSKPQCHLGRRCIVHSASVWQFLMLHLASRFHVPTVATIGTIKLTQGRTRQLLRQSVQPAKPARTVACVSLITMGMIATTLPLAPDALGVGNTSAMFASVSTVHLETGNGMLRVSIDKAFASTRISAHTWSRHPFLTTHDVDALSALIAVLVDRAPSALVIALFAVVSSDLLPVRMPTAHRTCALIRD